MFGGYEIKSAELDNSFEKELIIANPTNINLIEAIRILFINKNPYLADMVKDYFKYWNKNVKIVKNELVEEIQVRSNQSKRQKNTEINIDMKMLIDFVNKCIQENREFINIFQRKTIKTGKRKLVSKHKNELFTNRPDLVEKCSKQLNNKWWIGTNNSNKQIGNFYEIAKQINNELK